MKKFYPILINAMFFVLIAGSVSAQQADHFSPAYDESLRQKAMNAYPLEKWDSLRCAWYGDCNTVVRLISPRSTCPLTKRMFGWHLAGSAAYQNYVWGSLSDLSYFSYTVDPSTGNATNSSAIANLATDPAVVAAENNNVRVNLCVTLFNSTNQFSTFFGSSSAQSNLISKLVSAVTAAHMKGINIDFEGSGLGSTYMTQFVSFMSSLSTQLHNAVQGSELSVDLTGSQSGSTTLLTQLNSSVDLFMMMGYDYYYDGSSTAGPVAPLYAFNGTENVSGDINNYLQAINPAKFVLGVPYYGRTWPTGQSNCVVPTSASAAGNTFTYAVYKANANGYFNSPHRDPASFNPYFCYDYSGTWKQAFTDDDYSYQKKYNVIKQRGLAGIAVWALGYDDGYSDLWNLANSNLSNCAYIACTDTIYDMGGPQGNYHNNEKYAFTISPPGAVAVTLAFQSFNLESGYDSLYVYNGTSTSSPLLGGYTGSTIPASITANSGSMTIRFKSDGSFTDPGYSAIYSCSVACVDNYEPNDNTGSAYNLFATPLSSTGNSTTVNSFIFSGTDADYYEVNVSNGSYGTLNINLTNLPANYDMQLYSNTGQLISTSAQSGTSSEGINYNYTVSSSYQPPFYVKVYPDNSSQYSQCSAYTLAVLWSPSVCQMPAVPVITYGNTTCPGPASFSSTVNLGWSSSGNANYNYQIEEYPYGSSNQVYAQTCVSGTAPAVNDPAIISGKLYRYHVQATTDCNTCNSNYSQDYYFQLAPVISPGGTVAVCDATGATLSAPGVSVPSPGTVSYQWYQDGVPVGSNSSSYYASVSGNYNVKLFYSGSSICTGYDSTALSDAVYVSISAAPGSPALTSNSPVCEGSLLMLNASAQSGADFHWTGPNNFAVDYDNVVKPYASLTDAGTYSCYITLNGCQSSPWSVDVVVNPLPVVAFTYQLSGGKVIFTNTSAGSLAYSWLFGDGQGSAQASPSHTYPGKDNYIVILTGTDANDCSNADTVIVPVIAAGITEESLVSNLLVSPNPSNGNFIVHFETSQSENVQLKIFDAIGRIVYEEKPFKTTGVYSTEIKLNNIPAGIYNLQLEIGGKMINRKIEIN